MGRTIRGKNFTWEKQNLVGKGDAGEVYLVTTKKPPLSAVLKCPAKVATGGSIMRQASQIENEGRILTILDGLDWSDNRFTLITPKILDESIPGTSKTAAYFIISQQASGVSLEDLLKQAQYNGKPLSHRLLLKIISAMFQLFELIHAKNILWNDVKPGHIFWDEITRTITVIDWGNGIILKDKSGKSSQPGRFIEDIRQMLSEFGRILETTAPQLVCDLGWPQGSLLDLNDNDVDILRKRVTFLENYYAHKVVENRAFERLFQEKIENVTELDQLITSQNELFQLGEAIDHQIVSKAASSLILGSIQKGQIETCRMILERIKLLPWFRNSADWELVDTVLSSNRNISSTDLIAIIKLIFSASWVELYWMLYRNDFFDQDNQARKGLSYRLRQLILPEACAIYHVRDMVKDLLDEHHIKVIQARMKDSNAAELGILDKVSAALSIINKYWTDDHTTGFMGDHLFALQHELPNLRQIGIQVNPCLELMINTQAQQVRMMLFAWNSADFENLHKALRELFIWDPDMPDVGHLDTKIASIDLWMQKLISGPQSQTGGVEFIQEMIDQYPDLTQELGSPIWLKELLTGLSDLQKAEGADQVLEIINSYQLPISWWDKQNNPIKFL
jgi:serine/threonine protein kinase